MVFWGMAVSRNRDSWGDDGKNHGSILGVVTFSYSSASEYYKTR